MFQNYLVNKHSVQGDVQTKAGCQAIVQAIADEEAHVRDFY